MHWPLWAVNTHHHSSEWSAVVGVLTDHCDVAFCTESHSVWQRQQPLDGSAGRIFGLGEVTLLNIYFTLTFHLQFPKILKIFWTGFKKFVRNAQGRLISTNQYMHLGNQCWEKQFMSKWKYFSLDIRDKEVREKDNGYKYTEDITSAWSIILLYHWLVIEPHSLTDYRNKINWSLFVLNVCLSFIQLLYRGKILHLSLDYRSTIIFSVRWQWKMNTVHPCSTEHYSDNQNIPQQQNRNGKKILIPYRRSISSLYLSFLS